MTDPILLRPLATHYHTKFNETGVGVFAEPHPDSPAPNHYQVHAGGRIQHIHFQDGPIKEVGVNGLTIESLLAICMDRLDGFQATKHACAENKDAIKSIAAALSALHIRTERRIEAGIEGTNEGA